MAKSPKVGSPELVQQLSVAIRDPGFSHTQFYSAALSAGFYPPAHCLIITRWGLLCQPHFHLSGRKRGSKKGKTSARILSPERSSVPTTAAKESGYRQVSTLHVARVLLGRKEGGEMNMDGGKQTCLMQKGRGSAWAGRVLLILESFRTYWKVSRIVKETSWNHVQVSCWYNAPTPLNPFVCNSYKQGHSPA